MIDPLSQTTSYTSTLNGQVETVTLPNETVIRTVYNGFGQKAETIEDDGGLNVTVHSTPARSVNTKMLNC